MAKGDGLPLTCFDGVISAAIVMCGCDYGINRLRAIAIGRLDLNSAWKDGFEDAMMREGVNEQVVAPDLFVEHRGTPSRETRRVERVFGGANAVGHLSSKEAGSTKVGH
jgi:hypothetical protein